MKMKSSGLLQELGRIESGQLKILVTCSTDGCPNTREFNATEWAIRSLRADQLFVECSLCEASRKAISIST